MSLYSEIAAEVAAAFQGDLEAASFAFRRYAVVTDLVEGTVDPSVAESMELRGLLLPASQGTIEAFDVRFMSDVIDATNVRFGIFAAEGAPFVPRPGDRAVLYADDVEWQVLGCTPINVDGVSPILFSVGFRLP